MPNHIVETLSGQLPVLAKAAFHLPIAAVLGAALAFRPRRSGTPLRDLKVIHTQILLAVVGALVMFVIGDSLARAFGIVGAAGLVRYRARIKDPKDAVVMLATLGVGLAAGVGLYLLAIFATLFFLLVLWLVESHTPKAQLVYRLKFKTAQPFELRRKLEGVLRRHHVSFELLDISDDEIEYETRVELDGPTGQIESDLKKLSTENVESFTWERKKKLE
jgi:uncharacterized membrane protein YhiD involved in acid resistance